MLCEFANRFPRDLAQLLERDRHLTRNFREETATDLLMMGLMPLQPLGVRVDFPDEKVTGADMDWIYAAPHEVDGGSYLRLMIQSKRCKEQKLKNGSSYWYYDHLDHGTPKGSQIQTLVNHAATSPDGMATLPLYMFYHPQSALQRAAGALPAIEGINIRLARDLVGMVAGGCKRKEKKVSRWRTGFMSLSDLLCWPVVDLPALPSPPADPATEFILPSGFLGLEYLSIAFHPDLVAERINVIRGEAAPAADADFQVRPSRELPDSIRRAIAGEVTDKDRATLQRPRVILSTPLTREDPSFDQARAAVRRRRGRPAGN
ncbi:hypothetical protein LB517_24510 [Mesorhizobium sp. BR1-1-12]|uniref:DUF6615 family protein n=1 Tax=unclassified Mesorhizobium TaxID=325217 RepID=UPI001CCF0CCF|nr:MULTISPECIES: DUF6615 family protein [unclassified Mesorhizobium]MBZ9920186.1 hypothetical protein [Mesorhizobium sp. BR1-1-7]MBZ9972800.1 hypothetical protein [Mesorhizobium sp. BR1-1-12]